jgi:hypothetical protein
LGHKLFKRPAVCDSTPHITKFYKDGEKTSSVPDEAEKNALCGDLVQARLNRLSGFHEIWYEVTEGTLSGMREFIEIPFSDSHTVFSGVSELLHYLQHFFTYVGEILYRQPPHTSPLSNCAFRTNRSSERNT